MSKTKAKDAVDLCCQVESIDYLRRTMSLDPQTEEVRSAKLDDMMADILPLARRVFSHIGFSKHLSFGPHTIGWDHGKGEPYMVPRISAIDVKLPEPGPEEEDDTAATYTVPRDDDSLIDLTDAQITDEEAERISFVGSMERNLGVPLSVLPEAATTAALAKFKQFQAARDNGEDMPKRSASHAANGVLIGGAR